MERVRTQRFAEEVQRGLEFVPKPLLELTGTVHWFEGSLSFAGMRDGDDTEMYACHLSPLHFRWRGGNADRCCSTVVFPGQLKEERSLECQAVIHEFGHALQCVGLGSYDDRYRWWERSKAGLPDLSGPITDYEADTYCEQVSEALCAWLLPCDGILGRLRGAPQCLLVNEPALLAFFNELAGWPTDLPPMSLRA